MNESTTMIDEAVALVESGQDLARQRMNDIVTAMLQGTIDDPSMRQLLIALHAKGESVDEMVGAAEALRSAMTTNPYTAYQFARHLRNRW